MVDPVTGPTASGKSEDHVLKAGPDVVVLDRWGTRGKLNSLAAYHRGMPGQRIMEPVTSMEPRQRQGLPGAGHGHVVEPPRVVRALTGSDAVPAPVKHSDVVELEPLGPVAGQQQQAVLAAADVPPPLRQPFDEMIDRRFPSAGFQLVLSDGLPQQIVPGIGGTCLGPGLQSGAIDQAGISPSQPFHQRPGLPEAPEIRDLLVAHLRRNAVRLAEGAHRDQVFPLPCDHGATRPVPIG